MESYRVKINGIDVDASYSERAVKEVFLPVLQTLTRLQAEKTGIFTTLLREPIE